MKFILTVAISALISSTSFALPIDESKICEQIEEQAWDNCRLDMCKDSVETDTPEDIRECLNSGDGDLNEGAQICVVDGGEFESLLEKYNSEHPDQTLKCELP